MATNCFIDCVQIIREHRRDFLTDELINIIFKSCAYSEERGLFHYLHAHNACRTPPCLTTSSPFADYIAMVFVVLSLFCSQFRMQSCPIPSGSVQLLSTPRKDAIRSNQLPLQLLICSPKKHPDRRAAKILPCDSPST